MEYEASDTDALRATIETATRLAGVSLDALTVLTTRRDPYRLDTPSGHRDGKWLTQQAQELGTRPIHLRGLHYAIVMAEARKPDGTLYRNDDDDWEWLQERAAKCARWLAYIPFNRIIDARNASPIVRTSEPPRPIGLVSAGVHVEIPNIADLTPCPVLIGFTPRQPYRLVFFGEKTSLEDVMAPLAARYNADLYLMTGEISDTYIWQMARDGAADGRPMVVFTLADFDPAGHQMAVSIARKLQAFRDRFFPALKFSVYPVALTEDQVRRLDLPSTPIKAKEVRADRWREAHGGLQQTEIDALTTLRPDELRRIVNEAVRPFYDGSLVRRAEQVRSEWIEAAQTALNAGIDHVMLARLRAEMEQRLETLRQEIDGLNETLRTTANGVDLPDMPGLPDAVLPARIAVPLIDSNDDWITQTRALIARKKYGNGGSEP
ncbi:hypothetical protein AOQ72_10560 [Bradyrhizobium yuanmingense]|uniref:Uncharacterized protein n=2 Tax=Bradyrhizobium yuanmingense TaxID=108015 RepID=A0A0R3CWA2_9BRAD|nr:hypothetical protein AOQ72_10560 [Bradyrhizobium yuanmingense]